MSTYLFAFAVVDFKYKERMTQSGIRVRKIFEYVLASSAFLYIVTFHEFYIMNWASKDEFFVYLKLEIRLNDR